MNKKYLCIPLLCLALAACGKQAEAETTVATTQPQQTTAATTAPAETDAQYAWVRGEDLGLSGGFLEAGTQVEVTGYTASGLAQVTTSLGTGTVDPQLLRLSGTFAPWQGYARWNASFFENWDLLGAPMELLAGNTQVQVLEELDKCYYVRYNDTQGYIAKEQLSQSAYTAPSQGGDSGSGSGASGGSAKEGDDIYMMVPKLDLLAGETGTAIVKVDRVPLMVGTAKLDQQVRLSQEAAPSGWTAIQDGEATRYLPTAWLLFGGQPEYTAWQGYAGYSCRLYASPDLSGQPVKQLPLNAQVTVLWDTGAVSLVQSGSDTGYVSSGTLRQSPQATQPPEGSSTGGSNSGSSNSGTGSSSSSGNSGGSTGSSNTGDGWTPEVY